MCGIAGQIALDPDHDADRAQVQRMLRGLAHRGPDGEGIFTDPSRRLAFGMRRLAIIDLVSGQQPIFSEDGNVACVFNGEIYNFQALRTELEGKGHRFATSSDTEAIVHLYEEEGIACLRRLRGMFALALWDQRRESLVIARDRLGKKPLYYVEAGGRLSFASEIQVLYDVPSLDRTIDPVALDLYLTHSYIPAPHSVVRAIRKLPPAHCLVVRRGRPQITRYWRLSTTPTLEASRPELARLVRDKFEEAVRLRMISDVPLGCFLSGGVDSSAVAAVMSRTAATPVKTFSIGFTSDRLNELPYAREIADHYRTEHHEFVVDADVEDVLSGVVRHLGEPFGDASAVPTWCVAQLASKHVTVALNGDGGDELFAGYPWYGTALAFERLRRFLPRRLPALPLPPGRWERALRRLRLPEGERFATFRRVLEPAWRSRLCSPAVLDGAGVAADRYVLDQYEAADGDALARMQYADVMTYLPDDLLVKVDRMTMAHSLEGRSPLLDHELLEICARIPSRFKISRGRTKAIFKEAVADLFPAGFLKRPKMGFSPPVAEWLRGPLRGRCRAAIRRSAEHGWLDINGADAMLDEHLSGRRDWSAPLWNVLMLGEWAAVYVS